MQLKHAGSVIFLALLGGLLLPQAAEASHGHVSHRVERFHDAPSFGLAFDLGINSSWDRDKGPIGGVSSLRLNYRKPFDNVLGYRLFGEVRGDRIGDKLVFSPGLGAGIGLFAAATYNGSVSLDLIGSGYAGPNPEGSGMLLGVQTGLEGGWWWVPAAAHYDVGFGFILRGLVGTDNIRGPTTQVSAGLAVQF